MANMAGAYLGFCSMRQLGVCFFPLDVMLDELLKIRMEPRHIHKQDTYKTKQTQVLLDEFH